MKKKPIALATSVLGVATYLAGFIDDPSANIEKQAAQLALDQPVDNPRLTKKHTPHQETAVSVDDKANKDQGYDEKPKSKLQQRAHLFRKGVIETILNNALPSEMAGEGAVELLLGTAIQESDLLHRKQDRGGSALGVFQMEPNTHDDIWKNYLKYHPKLAQKVSALLIGNDKHYNLKHNDFYAAAMARVHYHRNSRSSMIPEAGNLKAQAEFWKQKYNTSAGKGKVSEYVHNWTLYN